MMDEVKQLEEAIRHHNHAYFVLDKPEISDFDFDSLVERLRILQPDSPALLEVGSDLQPASSKMRHKRPMLSLDKCYDLASFTKWFEKIRGAVLAMPKIDGVACSLKYLNGEFISASTRGDGQYGEDITANMRHVTPSLLSEQKAIEIRGEVYLKRSRFDVHYQEAFSNPRNLAAGALKQKDADKSAAYQLSFFPYDLDGIFLKTESQKFELLKQLGFEIMPLQLAQSPEACEVIYENLKKERFQLDYEIDGVVFRADQVSEQTRLGITAHHPRSSIAYKFQGDTAKTQLIDVEWSLGRTGVITPVAIIEPVQVSGALISRASLHNLKIFENLGLSKNAVVLVARRGGVIPHIDQVLESTGELLKHPESCPSCKREAIIDGEFLCCPTPEDCPLIKTSRLIHFCSVLELEGFGEKIISKLMQAGFVKNPADLFKLTLENLLSLERIGDKSAQNLLDQIVKKRVLSLPVFLTALGFDELGPNIAEILAKHFGSLEKLEKASFESLTSLFGIGESIAHSVQIGFEKFKPEITDLLEEIKIEEQSVINLDPRHPLFNKSVVFTGTLQQFDRKEAQKKVRDLGGQTPASVSAQTDFVVVGEGPVSTKQKAAHKLGVRILTEDDFKSLLERNLF